jgi:hypothetical protein
MSKFLLWFFMMSAFISSVHASDVEKHLQVVFIGKFANFIEWPQNKKTNFTITLLGENPFNEMLSELYKEKKINNKPIKIRYIKDVQDIGQSDILYITIKNPKTLMRAIEYAQENSIVTISQERGFAQRGGIIQLDFSNRKAHIVINNYKAVQSKLKISAALLAIASQVIKGDRE